MNELEGEDMMILTSDTPPTAFRPLRKARSFSKRPDAVKTRMAQTKRSLDNLQVRLIGDVGLIQAIQTTTMKESDGSDRTFRIYYTSVWARRDGKWQALSAQYTDLPSAKVQP